MAGILNRCEPGPVRESAVGSDEQAPETDAPIVVVGLVDTGSLEPGLAQKNWNVKRITEDPGSWIAPFDGVLVVYRLGQQQLGLGTSGAG